MCKPARYARHTPLCYVPLYRLDPENVDVPFRHHGTGTLILFEGRPLLLTAVHVVENAPHGLGVFLTTDSKIHALPAGFSKTAIPAGHGREDDFLDIAAIALSAEFAAGITFLTIGFYILPNVPANDLPPGTELKFAGFPAIAADGNSYAFHTSDGAHLFLRPQCVNSPLLPVANYPQSLTDACLVSPFMNPSTRDDDEWAEATFLPKGMSGGPVFAVQGEDVRLVGIATNWGDKAGFFVGTHLASVADVIDKAVAAAP